MLTYTISGGADMDAFAILDIHSGTGQITVGEGTDLDFEGDQTEYMVEVTADDPFDRSDSTMVTIIVTNVNERPDLTLVVEEPVTPVTPTPEPENNAPVFADDATTRSVNENTAAGMPVGAPVTATDDDADDTLTYTLGGDDMASFAIDAATGQIMTSADLDYETQASYSVTVTAMDEAGANDSITVAINVTNVGLDNAYDMDDSGDISKEEVLDAIGDYFDDTGTSKDDVLDLIGLYFGS